MQQFMQLCKVCKKYSKNLKNKGIKVFDKGQMQVYNNCIKKARLGVFDRMTDAPFSLLRKEVRNESESIS